MRRAAAFSGLLLWCGLLLAARVVRSGSLMYFFLAWNLFLAVIPALAAWMLAREDRRNSPVVVQLFWAGLWLAFLPNAPYIVTDLLHLRVRPPVPLWYDSALLLSCAVTGLLLGYASVADVQRFVARRFGPVVSWLCAATALLLSGFGIYLGRFLRWNSWNILTDPLSLAADVASRVFNPWAHPRTLAVTAVYSTGLFVGYVALHLLINPPFNTSPRTDLNHCND